ncbi:LuxR C-terminal-related transcriptional regulator [Govanella unica]|uniref:LuxR C-terminal-related transcriptional regulator n=1 Tax=Govanella unica TaxID=2975056 RepID=A0A9X3Z809_9PROT|nr:LuxR C-terminal-related transcriptional regulator [Govania unica]MDA5194539.1 LuxR C-terminal-related transcriptional regulator [Govania unica]
MTAGLPTPSTAAKLRALMPHRYGPALGHGAAVVRRAQIRQLTVASLTHRLTLLRAPSGAGKTTLLGQWLDVLKETGRVVAWLSLEADDASPLSLIEGLIGALADNGQGQAVFHFTPEFGDEIRAALDISIAAAARRLAAALNGPGFRGVLILDRFESIDRSPSGTFIAVLLQHLAALNVVIASRHRPQSLPLSNLRARDELAELTMADLHLDVAEMQALFGDDLPDQYARKLHLLTGGSPVALQFARRAIDALPGDEHMVADTAHRPLAIPNNWLDWLDDYYSDEILGALQSDLQHVMNRLVIVERFDLSLAEAIAGPQARQMVNRLYSEQGLLVHDRFTNQFHFPETLRQFLEKRLQWLDEAELAALHARAAAWFMERGNAVDALHHAVAANNQDMASQLLEQLGIVSVAVLHGVPSLKSMMSRVAPLAETVSLQARLAWSVIRAHEGGISEASKLLDQAKVDIAAAGESLPATMAFDCALAEGLLDGFTDRHMSVRMSNLIIQQLARTPRTEHPQRALLHVLLSWEAFRDGRLDDADQGVNDAATEYAAVDGGYGSIFMNIHRTLIRFWRNDLEGARHECLIAERMAHLFYPGDERLRMLTKAIKSGLLFDLDPEQQPAALLELAAQVNMFESWCEVLLWSANCTVQAAIRDGRIDDARRVLDQTVAAAKRLTVEKLVWAVDCLRAEIETLHGDRYLALDLAERLSLPDIDHVMIANVDLTWRERIGGLLTYGLILRREGRLSEAASAADRAAQLLTVTPIPRLAARLAVLRAHLALAAGKEHLVRPLLAEARATFPNLVSRQIFLEQDGAGLPSLAPYLPAFSTDPERVTQRRTPMLTSTFKTNAPSAADPLTAREREILQSMREGHPNKVTAHRLGLSEATVKFHLRNIYRKLDARNRTQALARYAAIAGAPYGL